MVNDQTLPLDLVHCLVVAHSMCMWNDHIHCFIIFKNDLYMHESSHTRAFDFDIKRISDLRISGSGVVRGTYPCNYWDSEDPLLRKVHLIALINNQLIYN